MKRIFPLIVLMIFLAGCSVGRGCREKEPEPPTVTVPAAPTIAATASRTPVPITATAAASPGNPATATSTAVGATSTPDLASSTPTRQPDASATPALIGAHRVEWGETMIGIGLVWYAGRYFSWGREIWEPICAANPEVADCRLIYPGDLLRIPALP